MSIDSQSSMRRFPRIGWAFLARDAIEDVAYPLSFVLRQVGIIFPILLYFFVAQLVPSSSATGDYFSATVIGLSTAALLQFAVSGFGGSLQRAQNLGYFETLLVQPVSWTLIPFAWNFWNLVLGALTTVLMFAIGIALGGEFMLSGVFPFVGLAVLGCIASVGVGILSASLMVLAKKSQPVLTVYGLLASLLGGALYPISVLPEWLRPLSYLVPHSYVISGSRQLLMVDPPQQDFSLSTAFLALLIFNVVVLALGIPLFRNSLQLARRMGTLSGY